jgi:membrane protein required for beta-lactamase induction
MLLMVVADVVWHPLPILTIIVIIVSRPLQVVTAVAGDFMWRLDPLRTAAESSNNHAAHAQHKGQ